MYSKGSGGAGSSAFCVVPPGVFNRNNNNNISIIFYCYKTNSNNNISDKIIIAIIVWISSLILLEAQFCKYDIDHIRKNPEIMMYTHLNFNNSFFFAGLEILDHHNAPL